MTVRGRTLASREMYRDLNQSTPDAHEKKARFFVVACMIGYVNNTSYLISL